MTITKEADMQIEKKVTLKEDGRFLVYYHFPETATEDETNVFHGIESVRIESNSIESIAVQKEKPDANGDRPAETETNLNPVPRENTVLSSGGPAHV